MARLARGIRVAKLCASALVLSQACAARAGSAIATLTVTITVLPSRAQQLKLAELRLVQPDGTLLVLNRQQRAQYIERPASITKYVRPGPGGYARLSVDY